MSLPEPPTPVCAEHLGALHRYACLLTGGDPAATSAAVDATLDRAAVRSGDIRCPLRTARWLFAELRLQCRQRSRRVPAAAVASPTDGAASAFAALPEPERAALALFYVGPFRRLELADTLGGSAGRPRPAAPARPRPAGAAAAPEEEAAASPAGALQNGALAVG